jgi:hypothetical protein
MNIYQQFHQHLSRSMATIGTCAAQTQREATGCPTQALLTITGTSQTKDGVSFYRAVSAEQQCVLQHLSCCHGLCLQLQQNSKECSPDLWVGLNVAALCNSSPPSVPKAGNSCLGNTPPSVHVYFMGDVIHAHVMLSCRSLIKLNPFFSAFFVNGGLLGRRVARALVG